jgi:hypothetical protein
MVAVTAHVGLRYSMLAHILAAVTASTGCQACTILCQAWHRHLRRNAVLLTRNRHAIVLFSPPSQSGSCQAPTSQCASASTLPVPTGMACDLGTA